MIKYVLMDKIYKALADNNRRKILKLLKTQEYSVNELGQNFEITQATLSNHLAILRKAGLVNVKVDGKKRIYGLQKDSLIKISEDLGCGNYQNIGSRRVNL